MTATGLVADDDHVTSFGMKHVRDGLDHRTRVEILEGFSEGGREGTKIGVIQVDVHVAARVDALLDVLDGPVGRVVVHQ